MYPCVGTVLHVRVALTFQKNNCMALVHLVHQQRGRWESVAFSGNTRSKYVCRIAILLSDLTTHVSNTARMSFIVLRFKHRAVRLAPDDLVWQPRPGTRRAPDSADCARRRSDSRPGYRRAGG
jgi:hypothetical protein